MMIMKALKMNWRNSAKTRAMTMKAAAKVL